MYCDGGVVPFSVGSCLLASSFSAWVFDVAPCFTTFSPVKSVHYGITIKFSRQTSASL